MATRWWRKTVKSLGLHQVWADLGEDWEDANYHGAWSNLTAEYNGEESWAHKIEEEIRRDERIKCQKG